MKNKKIYYDIYNEFNSINKFRELKTIKYNGSNRLNHINRVAKLSFYISKRLGLDYISCTRGAIMHNFFVQDDIKKRKKVKQDDALNNSKEYFKINDLEKEIILSKKLLFKNYINKECKIVCLSDKIINIYEFFRYKLNFSIDLFLVLFLKLNI